MTPAVTDPIDTQAEAPGVSSVKGFVLSVDSTIIHSVGELLFSADMTETIKECRESYRRALEDFAFALVYGSQIRSRPDKKWGPWQGGLPHGSELVRRLPNKLYRLEHPDDDCFEEALFRNPAAREQISDYISSMSRAMRDQRVFALCRDWLKREAKMYLGTDPSLFGEGGGKFGYCFVKSWDLDDLLDLVPQLLGESLVAKLTGCLPRAPEPGGEQYAPSALRQFTLQTILMHVTLMLGYQRTAERHKRWRMHVLSSEILLRFRETHMQRGLRQIAVGHALCAALSRLSGANDRKSIITVLLALRKNDAFRRIREMLEHLTNMHPH